MKRILAFTVVGFCLFCGVLVIESGLFENPIVSRAGCILLQQTAEAENVSPSEELPAQSPQLEPAPVSGFNAEGSPAQPVTLGSIYPDSEFKFQLKLTSKGAAIAEAVFSEFDNRDPDDPQPLQILSPAGEAMSMANKEFIFVEQELQLRLDNLHFKSSGVERGRDGSETASFETVITEEATGEPVIKIVKTYKIRPGSYDVECNIAVENLSGSTKKTCFNLAGPLGIKREDARRDVRKVIAGFKNSKGKVVREKRDLNELRKATIIEERRLQGGSDVFLWAGVTNKYFAAILVPMAEEGHDPGSWIEDKSGRFFNPDRDAEYDSGDETVGMDLKIANTELAAVGQANSTKKYNFVLFLGPKDNNLFNKNELYRELGFIQTIDFLTCCCPAALISPLAFGILNLMKWMYSFIGNYGIVIIILVLLLRLCIHPLTKKSQVSMSKFSKLAPKIEEVKKKYANNKSEMNKQMMALYREQGASPITGMLPMFVQMPVWLALYSAIYASIELRGAAFLPFWITDLSVPDALIRFKAFSLPLFGELNSFNLLPILMGVAFYVQQKLMPQQAAASEQAAQQQKIMKIMFPLLFPLMLYKAPSGLNLYIMSSISAGAVEQYLIRKHIREKEQAEEQGLVPVTKKTGGKVKKKKPKPFFKDH
ncbi:YidC/Oxa1 family insertase periplasmic-domain containing protein [Planctomycetota bacterium]